MMQLSALLWGMALLFGYIGYSRGWNKEVISLSGIVLGLFALFEFDDVLRGTLLANVPAAQVFLVQTVIFGVIVFFAYQTKALIGADVPVARRGDRERDRDRDRDAGRDQLQTNILGAVVGFLNGYLIWGTLWYFMHINSYPLAPYLTRPTPGSPSDVVINQLPLFLLAGGPAGDGNLLAGAVIVLFLIVLIVI
ncbi:MAG: CvpA family protein [Armatimonadetes bacterium]|nr:CvpA family protein [Anaerolineae bacterium]